MNKLSIIKILIIIWIVIGIPFSIYNAGKYANGYKEVHEGKRFAVYNLIGGFINTCVALALYLDW
ncbi:MAG: hypothetical protein WC365_07635 [Candidatus Babeliales bacterium]|jgi:hypothetical protein